LPDACAWLRKTDAFCGKRYRKRAFLPEPPWLRVELTRKAKQKAKAKERDQTRQGNAGAHADARPEVAGEPDIVNEVDEDAESGNLAVPASGETKPEGGAEFGNRR
jgi:hypothetical protein